MKKGIALSPYKTYVHPVMKTKEIQITEVVHYGGEDSESVPCGFIAEFKYEGVITKRQNKNKRYRQNKKAKALVICDGSLGDIKMKS